MEEDRPKHQLPHAHESIIWRPIEGMESVVATVSGYHGLERFNLIRLISHTGANYVGAMSRSITHLICWKFEGKKYSLAQKFNIVTVNHRWVEDCIKQGRRVPEDSYIFQSGQQVGQLLLEVPPSVQASGLTKDKVLSDLLDDVSQKQIAEFSSGPLGDPVRDDFCSLNKELSSSSSSRQSRKEKRKISNKNGVAISAEHSRKGRRFIKNKVDVVVLDPLVSDVSPDDHLSRKQRPHTDTAAPASLSGGVTNNNISKNRKRSDDRSYYLSGPINGGFDHNEHMKDLNNLFTSRNSSSYVEEPLHTTDQPSIDLCSGEPSTDGSQVDHVARLPTSTELSCVICLTDFSSTRGILQCGHRFCYSCIQNWVDKRTSMGKSSICPLCKASFNTITKVEHAAATDQKVYSQTIPCDASVSDIVILNNPEFPNYGSESLQTAACVVCRCREPEELLWNCHYCQIRRIHSYCLDPPLLPWTCSHCKDLQVLYHHHHSN